SYRSTAASSPSIVITTSARLAAASVVVRFAPAATRSSARCSVLVRLHSGMAAGASYSLAGLFFLCAWGPTHALGSRLPPLADAVVCKRWRACEPARHPCAAAALGAPAWLQPPHDSPMDFTLTPAASSPARSFVASW